jgi:hypothetical protein
MHAPSRLHAAAPVRVVVADERNEQGTDQRDQPSPVEITQHRPHLGPADHIGQSDSGRQFQQYRHDDQASRSLVIRRVTVQVHGRYMTGQSPAHDRYVTGSQTDESQSQM